MLAKTHGDAPHITYYGEAGQLVWTSQIVEISPLDQAWVEKQLAKSNAELLRWDQRTMTGVAEFGPFGILVVISHGPPNFGSFEKPVRTLMRRLMEEFPDLCES